MTRAARRWRWLSRPLVVGLRRLWSALAPLLAPELAAELEAEASARRERPGLEPGRLLRLVGELQAELERPGSPALEAVTAVAKIREILERARRGRETAGEAYVGEAWAALEQCFSAPLAERLERQVTDLSAAAWGLLTEALLERGVGLRAERTLAVAECLLERGTGDVALLAELTQVRGLALWHRGQPVRARSALRRARELALSLEDDPLAAEVLLLTYLLERWAGDDEAAEAAWTAAEGRLTVEARRERLQALTVRLDRLGLAVPGSGPGRAGKPRGQGREPPP